MTLVEVQERARKIGIDPGGKAKSGLIHDIQQKEGYAPCFGWSTGCCQYEDCCWRQDCLGLIGLIKSKCIFEVIE